jgi:hypothetical protein
MNGSMTSNLHLLGINDKILSSLCEGRLPDSSISGQCEGFSMFRAQLEAILAGMGEEDTGEAVQDIKLGGYQGSSLSRIFLDSALAAMIPAGTEESDESNQINSQNLETDATSPRTQSKEALTTALSTEAATGAATLTPQQVVIATGNSQRDLLEQINASTTLEERLEYVTQLRDKIIEALRQEGYTAYDIGKPDKISIDGTLYDVVRASKALGNDAAVHFLEVPPTTASTQTKDAIFNTGEGLIDLLPRISASFDVAERRQLAVQFRDQLVENLKANGFSASVAESPDKIVVDGVTYDIIRNLNAPGSAVRLQAIQVN